MDVSVDGEWSYLQTLRHLVFATDRWISAPVLADSQPFHPIDLPNPPHDDLPPATFDLDARPTLEEVLIVRRDRMERVRYCLATASSELLDREVASPNGGTTTTRQCLHVMFREEWWHNQYALRDLAILEHDRSTCDGD